MFYLTRIENDMESGVYATKDDDGTTVVQFFVDKDDAVTYNDQLTAVGYNLSISEAPDEHVDKMCEVLGHAYTVAEPGDIVIPRMETLQDVLGSFFS
jgi:hypothetical protein